MRVDVPQRAFPCLQVWGVFLVTLLAVWLSLLASHTLQTNDGGRT